MTGASVFAEVRAGRHATADGRARRSPHGRRRAGRLVPIAICMVGVVGLFVNALALLPVGGWQVVRLATGSMAPALPTDSVLLVRRIPASQARVGDVVTVQRPHELPVTHRVVAVRPAGALTSIELRGDANASPDPAPYLVSDVDLLVVGVPWGGQLITAARSPIVLGTMTVLATMLVLWAWWPRRRGVRE